MKARGALVSSEVHAGAWYRSFVARTVAEEVDGCRPADQRASLRAGRRYSAAARARIVGNMGGGAC